MKSDPIDLPSRAVEAILPRLSYEGKYPSLVKKFVHPYWRLLGHMFILCMTEKRGGTDQLKITRSAAFVCLITNQAFNYSKFIFEGTKRNVTGVRKDKFIMYPRFLQMIFNARYPELKRSGNTLELKPMGHACFGALTTKKGTEKNFEGPVPLEKFVQFSETEDVAAEPVLHVVQGAAKKEPDTEILTINSDDEGIEISYDDDDDDEVELPPEAEVSSVVSAVQPVITSESLALLLKSTTEKMGSPPFDPLVQIDEQTLKDPEIQQVKKRRRDPRPSVYVEQNKDQSTEKDASATATATATDTVFDFDVDTSIMVVDDTSTEIPVTTTVTASIIDSTPPVTTAIASSSGTIHEEPCSSSGKRSEEQLRMPFVDDSSDDDDEFITMREMKKIMIFLEQDSIHKDAKIIQLEDTIMQKNQ
ncbi:hypothetical protein Hanom_Chr10g00911421 [Helianthus anomalus]